MHNGGKTYHKVDTHTVKELDIVRYMGRWYEIARFDHRFEQGLKKVTAFYTLRGDGRIEVLNSGYKSGQLWEARGKAKIPNPDDPGKLRVSFFWFFYSDYYVLELDEQYRYVLVGSSSDRFLWILSRTPEMPNADLKVMLEKVQHRGYDKEKLIYTSQ